MTTIEIPLADIGAAGPDRVLLGATQSGGRLTWHRTWKAHVMVSGETGSGKGGTLRAIQCHDVTTGAEMGVIAPDPGEFGWLTERADVVDDDAAPDLLDHVSDLLEARRHLLANTPHPVTGVPGVDNWTLLPDPPPWFTLYLDETPAVLGNEAVLSHGRKLVERMTTQVASIVKRGRKARVSLVLATQYPTLAGTFGTNPMGGDIRANLPARIHCDRITQSLHAVFDSGAPIPPATIHHLTAGVPGRVGYVFLDPLDSGTPLAGQIMWIRPEQAHQLTQGGR